MTNTKCKYCDSDLKIIDSEENKRINVKVLYCDSCRAEYLSTSNNILASVSMYVTFNDKTYRWTEINNGTRQLWHVLDFKYPGSRSLSNNKKIFSTRNSDINLTPQTIINKIKFYIQIL